MLSHYSEQTEDYNLMHQLYTGINEYTAKPAL